MLLFSLHKQYKEVDRSERGLCEKIIKSFRECQESIAQHCQHCGVLQAIIRWRGGGRHVWQLIPAWSPTEKQRAASTSYQAKWGTKVLESNLSSVSLFSQGASFGEELLSVLTDICMGHLACVLHSHNPLSLEPQTSPQPFLQCLWALSCSTFLYSLWIPEISNWSDVELVDCWWEDIFQRAVEKSRRVSP